jgi:hypothetical protein
MMAGTFKSWLITRKLMPKSIGNYLAECTWAEGNCKIDLDNCYNDDKMKSLLSRLRVGAGKDLVKLIDGDPSTNLATYRSAVRRYKEFRDEMA